MKENEINLKVEIRFAKNAKKATYEVRGNTYKVKDKLKERGYRWRGWEKVWWRRLENTDEAKLAEIEFLKSISDHLEIYPFAGVASRWLIDQGFELKDGVVVVK